MLVSAANNKGKQLLRTRRILMMGIERTSSRPPDNITLIITQKVLGSPGQFLGNVLIYREIERHLPTLKFIFHYLHNLLHPFNNALPLALQYSSTQTAITLRLSSEVAERNARLHAISLSGTTLS